ncbi:hypothetical protein AVEN_76478-1 [Araneus ventricosus]|uniref:Uncharacterized protein n=1 Tax=Araneus ventricosus TaxID=182803 RepID=A0A4Y2CEZ0_ARAVE|nr:hypothetical protein AVEN_76478-1 [Araneus ventricosus]
MQIRSRHSKTDCQCENLMRIGVSWSKVWIFNFVRSQFGVLGHKKLKGNFGGARLSQKQKPLLESHFECRMVSRHSSPGDQSDRHGKSLPSNAGLMVGKRVLQGEAWSDLSGSRGTHDLGDKFGDLGDK